MFGVRSSRPSLAASHFPARDPEHTTQPRGHAHSSSGSAAHGPASRSRSPQLTAHDPASRSRSPQQLGVRSKRPNRGHAHPTTRSAANGPGSGSRSPQQLINALKRFSSTGTTELNNNHLHWPDDHMTTCCLPFFSTPETSRQRTSPEFLPLSPPTGFLLPHLPTANTFHVYGYFPSHVHFMYTLTSVFHTPPYGELFLVYICIYRTSPTANAVWHSLCFLLTCPTTTHCTLSLHSPKRNTRSFMFPFPLYV